MNIERKELVELLRSRGNDQTAERAEHTLPQHVDLEHHRQILRQCGIDPVVLAFTLSRLARSTDVTGPPPQSAEREEDGDGPTTAEGVPGSVPAERVSSVRDVRSALGTTSGGRLSLQSPSPSPQQADQAPSTSGGKIAAGFRLTPRPAILCPRCRVAFGSPELMLEHLNDHHLNARHQTDAPVDIDDDIHQDDAVPDDEVSRLHAF